MIAYNSLGNEQKTSAARYFEQIKAAKKAKNIITDETVDLSKLTIPAKSTLVLELIN
ncbi:MAG: Cyclomaltodextrinase [Mucilaginibacter sp.]|nr:Cyclomaltodextrinase [Mucilaginibacter sp.]